MKATDSRMVYLATEKRNLEEWSHIVLEFTIHGEDFELAQKALDWMNEQSQGTDCPEMDLADFFMSCITREIHALTEARTGKPFVLRMDRKPN